MDDTTLEDRRAYQREEREAIAQVDPLLAEALAAEPTCVGCGCSEQLACPDGCMWAEVGLCSACAADGVRLVDVALTTTQARHTAAFLRASVSELDAGLQQAWEHTPVGQVWAVLAAAVTEDDVAVADERTGFPCVRRCASKAGAVIELDYAVSLSTDVTELRQENATLRARLREREAECQRWALRWAGDGLRDSGDRDLIGQCPSCDTIVHGRAACPTCGLEP